MQEGNTASAEWRHAVDRARGEREVERIAAPEPWQPEVVRRVDQPAKTPAPAKRKPRKPPVVPADIAGQLADAAGKRAPRARKELDVAMEAYVAGRYQDAERRLRPVVRTAPQVAAVRELYGLILYRLGRWKAALAELDAYHALTTDVTQYPVAADCERALGHHRAVERLWEELRQASPGVDVLSEGRLVLAGSLADRGKLDRAIAVLAPYEPARAHPKEWHLRTWYVLADLYERAGDVQRARELFRRLVRRDAGYFDAAERLGGLG